MEAAVAHPQLFGLGVHGTHEGGTSPGVMTRQRRGHAVFRRHQRQVQGITATDLGPHAHARIGVLDGVAIVAVHGEGLVEILPGIKHHQSRHQLGERGDGAATGCILLIERLAGADLHHQGAARLQLQFCRIGRGHDQGGQHEASQCTQQRQGAHLTPHTTTPSNSRKRR